MVLQPLLAQAGGLQADPNAAPANRPTIDVAGNGVPLVQIVTPNGAGLSHNKYLDFNVGTPGVILNNSAVELSQSQLGGLVQGNGNLAVSGPASTILNEVTGSNRSVLIGTLEVNGTPANVIIANQNGITCNGCGFLNTPRVTLSTGVPVLGADGSLSSLRVEGGDILIGVNGANATTVNVFDLMSRTISVNGPIAAAGDLNLIAGRNSIAYQTGLITPLASDGKEPAIAIDSSVLGGMYAGRIKLISTDKGAGVNMVGPMAANTAGMTLTADGRLVLGKAQAKGQIVARSVSDKVSVASTLFSDTAVVLQGATGVELADNALVASAGDVSLIGQTVTLGANAIAASGTTSDGVQSATGTLSVQATTLNVGNGMLAGGGLLSITAGTVNLARSANTGVDSLRSIADIVITADNIDGTNASISAGNNLSVLSNNALTLTSGTYLAGNNLLIQAASLTSSANVGALANATVQTTSGNLTNTGAIASNGATDVEAALDLSNTGRIVSMGIVTLAANGNLSNAATGLVAANGDVTVAAATLSNAGIIAAAQDGQPDGLLSVTTSGALANSGTLASLADADISSGGNVTNSGTIGTGGDLTLATNGALSVTATGKIVSQGTSTLTSTGATSVDLGGLINGAAGLNVGAASLTNNGEIGSINGALLAQVAGNISNTGVLYSGTSSTYQLGGTFSNTNADVIATTDLTIQGASGDGSYATAIVNTSGTIQSGNDMVLAANTITNQRTGVTFTVDTVVTTGTPYVEQYTSDTTVTRTPTTQVDTDVVTFTGVQAQILAGHDLTINAPASVTNSYSLISAQNNITINAGTVTNEGRNLIQTTTVTTADAYHQRYCDMDLGITCGHYANYYWDGTTFVSSNGITVGAAYATIQAGGNLNANITGYVINGYTGLLVASGNVPPGQQVGLYSGNSLPGVMVGPSSSLNSINTTVSALLGRKAMFDTPLDPNAPYLIETRSAFIDPSLFLGSDYFLSRIGYDPNYSIKRLGDAYVEYQIVENQIFDLTGKTSLDGGDPVSQMQKLYDNAIDEQQALGLTVGVALTPSQIAALTEDIIWMEQQTINGQDVLVPVVYLSQATLANVDLNAGQITAGGTAVITAGNLVNSGTISGDAGLGIAVDGTLVNFGGSLFSNSDIVVLTGADFINQSGSVAGDNVTIVANGDVINDTLVVRDTTVDGFQDRLQQDGTIVAQGSLTIQAGGDLTSQGGVFASGGDMTLAAGNDIVLNSQTVSGAAEHDGAHGDFDRSSSTTNIMTSLAAGGDMTLVAGNDFSATATEAVAGGLLTVAAGNDVTIAAGTDQASSESQRTSHSSQFLQNKTTTTYDASNSTTSVSSVFSGGEVEILAGNDITLKGSDVIAQADVTLSAGGNIYLGSTIDTTSDTHDVSVHTTGLMAAPGGAFGYAVGTRDVRDHSKTTTATNVGSLVGSMNGNVTIVADGDLAATASSIVAPNGDVTVVANSISIAAGIDTATYETSHDDNFKGLVVTAGGGPGSPAQSVQQAVTYNNAANKTKDGRARTLYTVATVGQGINAAIGLATNPNSLLSVQATIGYGTQKIHSESSGFAESPTDTVVIAGGSATLVATGGDVDLKGVGLAANDVLLSATGDVNLTSIALNSGSDSASSSSSSMIGYTVSADAKGGVGVGVTAQFSGSKSSSKDRATSYAPTVVSGANSVTIVSGRDTNLKGAQVYGGKIDLTVGRDLTIVSDQDTETQTADQSSWSAGGTIGVTLTPAGPIPNASVNASKSDGTASGDYTSVNNQSGLFAGDGGFNVDVGGVTTLTGAVIASTAGADKNKLKTGALVTSDLINSSQWNAKTSGYSLSVGTTGIPKPGMSPKQKDSGSDSSTAASAIAPGQIIITDPSKQQALTGKSAAETIANLRRDTSNTNRPLEALPDLQQKLQNQADLAAAQTAATEAVQKVIGAPVAKLIGDAAKKGDISTASQYIAQAALGCGLGAISGQCAAGAGGAVVGEAVGQLVVQKWVETQLQAIQNGTVDPVAFQQGLAEMQQQGADMAALAAGIAGALIGGSSGAGVGALTGENAAKNNAVAVLAVAGGALCTSTGVCIAVIAGIVVVGIIIDGSIRYYYSKPSQEYVSPSTGTGDGTDVPGSDRTVSKTDNGGPQLDDATGNSDPNNQRPPNPLDPLIIGAGLAGVNGSQNNNTTAATNNNGVQNSGTWVQVDESMSDRARDYQTQITGVTGQAYVVNGVKFDGVSTDGTTLLDAKGPGYENFVGDDGQFKSWYNGQYDLVDQAQRQLVAAQGQPIQWSVAEPTAATAIRNLLSSQGITGITVVNVLPK